MWKQVWTLPPQDADELFVWRVYTRCWNDAGLQSPGLWIIQWMKNDLDSDYMMEAIYWYINECKE